MSCCVFGTGGLHRGCRSIANLPVPIVTARSRQVGQVSCVCGWKEVEERLLITHLSINLSAIWRMMVGLVASCNVLVGNCLLKVPMRGG